MGDTVRRPWSPHTESVHALLRHLRAKGFTAAPEPLGIDDQGREVLRWIEGETAMPPYPDWARTDAYLVSVARLLRRMHDACAGFDPSPHNWSEELPDPRSGPVMCHNDLCLENLVARDGEVISFLDFDFVAPGRPVVDVVSTTRFVVPLRSHARRDPWLEDGEVFRRLRLFVDTYGLSEADRRCFAEVLEERRAIGERFVLSRASRGEQLFAHWLSAGGAAKLAAEREWIAANGDRITAALTGHGQL